MSEQKPENVNEAASAQSELNVGLRWIDAAAKPADHKPVVVIVDDEQGKYWARAMWVQKFTREDTGNYECDSDYNEADDTYYWPEGWYEWNNVEEIHWLISEPVILWAAVEVPNVELTGSALLRSLG